MIGAKIAVYGGSFDPLTYGHMDIVQRALTIFDKVIIGIAVNPDKTGLFTPMERCALIADSFPGLAGTGDGRVEARLVTGLLAHFAKDVGATALVRGLRSGLDFEQEQPMAVFNRDLSGGLETVLLAGDPALGHISSSMVKELASHGVDVSHLVPPPVAARLMAKYA